MTAQNENCSTTEKNQTTVNQSITASKQIYTI